MKLRHYTHVYRLVLLDCLLHRDQEPVAKVCMRMEDIRHKEMHERPKLTNIILQGSTSKKKPSLWVEIEQNLPSLGFEVLNVVGLIKDHVIPTLPSKDLFILEDKLVWGDTDVEEIDLTPTHSFSFSFFGSAKVGHNFEGWTPSFKLNFPVYQDTCGDNDEMRTPNALFWGEIC